MVNGLENQTTERLFGERKPQDLSRIGKSRYDQLCVIEESLSFNDIDVILIKLS